MEVDKDLTQALSKGEGLMLHKNYISAYIF
jgi:hypothetical protein